MGRHGTVQRAGLQADLRETPEGWHITLTDDSGKEVFSKVYATEKSARDNSRLWVQRNYGDQIEEKPQRRRPTGSPIEKSIGPAPSVLLQNLRNRADYNETQAVGLREQAELLETEAKRLRAAADTLEGE
jgi:hypothetical protein